MDGSYGRPVRRLLVILAYAGCCGGKRHLARVLGIDCSQAGRQRMSADWCLPALPACCIGRGREWGGGIDIKQATVITPSQGVSLTRSHILAHLPSTGPSCTDWFTYSHLKPLNNSSSSYILIPTISFTKFNLQISTSVLQYLYTTASTTCKVLYIRILSI